MENTAKEIKVVKDEPKIKYGKMTEAGVYHLPRKITREDAITDKLTLYYEGKCENDHKAPRYTRDKVCKECYRLKKLEKKLDKEKALKEKAEKTSNMQMYLN